MSDQLRGDLLKMMKEKAYRKGEYKLSSGKNSEHYVNCKPVILNGRGLWITSHLLLKTIEHDAKAVAGLTLGADPLVSGVAFASFQFWNNTNPKFMILDEATEGLAPKIREEIWHVLEHNLKESGQAILVIDKHPEAMARIADRHYVMDKGSLVWQGDSRALLRSHEMLEQTLGV